MVFSDPFFLFAFLPLSCLLFYVMAGRFGANAGMAVMLVASLIFYVPHGLFNLLLLMASVTINFAIGSALISLPDASARQRKSLFIAGELLNFAILVWFKYRIFSGFLPIGELGSWTSIAIPAGISFYTFHQAAFIADAYAREASVVRFLGALSSRTAVASSFVRYAAFVTFFPQLVIGPITYLKEFQPQVMRERFGHLRRVDVAVGVALIAIGLFKKIAIADNLAIPADAMFGAIGSQPDVSAVAAWRGVAAYYAQLYFDFSGYSDMALGIGLMFGIRYPANFFSPLKAVGIIDFYRRWHMTLTRVISRFLFTPLSLWGTRFGMRRKLPKAILRPLSLWIPLLINFEVIGLWHGAAETFLLFGLIHGAWYVLETEARATKAWKRWRKATSAGTRRFIGRALFLVPMMLTFALFRSGSPEDFWQLLQILFAGHWNGFAGIGQHAQLLLVAFGVIYLLPNSVELLRRYRPALLPYDNESYRVFGFFPAWRNSWPWAVFVVGLIAVAMFYIGQPSPFLYAGF